MESGKDNMFRFLCLNTEVVAKVLRSRLKQSYKNSNVQTLSSFLKDADILHTIFHLFFSVHSCCWRGCRTHASRVLSKKQFDILYDSDPSRCCMNNQNDPNKICVCRVTPKHVDEDDIDLSLLSCILINCCNLMPNEKEAVQKLREIKNEYISHNPKCSLTNSDFESLWNNSEFYIKHLDSTNIYLNTRENVLNRPMDESLMQKYFVESVKMKHEIKSVHASIDRGNENVLEAIKELRDDVVYCKTTKRKRHEFKECSDISYERDSTQDCISPQTKVQKLQKRFEWSNNKGNTDDWTHKLADTKHLDMNREFISSKLIGSNLSTSVSLQMDHTIFTVKDLSKRSDFEKMDKHICGKCGWLFVSLDQFLQHKEECKIRQKENEFVKTEYNKYILSRITIPTKNQELSQKIVTDWQQGKLEAKHSSMDVNYMTIGCVDIWIKVDVLLYLDIKHFYSALDDLVNGIFQKYSVEAPLYHIKVFDIATGYVDHINDESCCGDCKLKCNTLDEFISHKNTKCFQHLYAENDKSCPMESTFNETDGLCVKSKDVQTLSSLTSKLSYWCDDQIQQAQQPTNTTSGCGDHITDKFSCGDCKLNCNTIDDFVSDKKTRCFQSPLCTENPATNMTKKLSKEQLLAYEKCLLEWIVICSQVVTELNLLADNLDQHFQKIAKAKIGGSAAGVVGGVMATVGFGLSFVTFGASLGLAIAGGVIAGAGGLTVGGSAATDAILSRNRKKKAEEFIKKYNTKLEEVKNNYLEIHDELKKRAELSNLGSRVEEKFPHWFQFWWNLVKGAGQPGWSTGGSIIYTTIKSSFQLATAFDDAAITGLRVGGGVFKTFGTVGRAFHIVGGVANIVFIPLDIFTMVDSAIDVHKKNPHKTSSAMRKVAVQIEKGCPKKDEIQTMIAETLKQL